MTNQQLAEARERAKEFDTYCDISELLDEIERLRKVADQAIQVIKDETSLLDDFQVEWLVLYERELPELAAYLQEKTNENPS